MGFDSILHSLRELSLALLDAYVVVDPEQNVVDFNRSFYSLFPKNVARRLKRLKLAEILTVEVAGRPFDLAGECMEKGKPLRYDEVSGTIEGESMVSLIAAGVPITDENEQLCGAFLTFRNVTDEAHVQGKYKTMLEQEARAREILQQRVLDAEAELIRVKDQLGSVEQELLAHKKGLLI